MVFNNCWLISQWFVNTRLLTTNQLSSQLINYDAWPSQVDARIVNHYQAYFHHTLNHYQAHMTTASDKNAFAIISQHEAIIKAYSMH